MTQSPLAHVRVKIEVRERYLSLIERTLELLFNGATRITSLTLF